MRVMRVCADARLFAALILLLSLTWGSAWTLAQAQSEPLQLILEQYTVVQSAEEPDMELLLPFTDNEGAPGTVIEYQVRAVNVSEVPLADIILRLHVPVGTRYLEGSERYDRLVTLVQFSIDAGQTYRTPPILYFVEDAEGNRVQRIATADMYTDLRLVFLRPLAPAEEVIFSYRVQVE